MSNFRIKIIQPLSKIFLRVGGRRFFQKVGINETKVADYVVKKVIDSDSTYEVHGFKLKKGRTTRIPVLTGEIDPSITKIIKNNVKPDMSVFDLGANFGWFTLVLSKLVGESGHVYSFEADPSLVKTINENIKLNNLTNVSVFSNAVSNKSGTAKFNLNESYDTRSQLESSDISDNSIDVKTVSIDEFCEKNNVKPDFIKMDIEGSEPKALQGMKKIILSNPEIKIVSEFNQKAIKDVGSSPEEFFDLLSELKLEFKEIDEKNPGKLNAASKEELMTKPVSNLFCYRKNL